jgi:hypothetical protein
VDQGGGTQSVSSGGGVAADTNSQTTDTNGAHTHTFTTDSTGSGTAFGIVQPTIILNKIIYTSV